MPGADPLRFLAPSLARQLEKALDARGGPSDLCRELAGPVVQAVRPAYRERVAALFVLLAAELHRHRGDAKP